ncbi:MAG: hypothetical protein JNM75_09850 [Rhodospirillales bacterium]|nr:hypothetical protein [Rhodospirillales bacterium]
MKPAAAVFVYNMADTDAACAASAAFDIPLTVWMREDTAAGYGAAVIGWIFAIARAAHPEAAVRVAVDCGDAPGLALALMRRGIDRVSLVGSEAMLTRVAAIAAGYGAALAPVPPDALDLLGVDNPKKACASWLARFHNGSREPHGE